MNPRPQGWDTQDGYAGVHRRQDSTTSMSDVMTLPVRKAEDSYDYRYQQSYPPQAPSHAYSTTRDVPKFSDAYGGPQR